MARIALISAAEAKGTVAKVYEDIVAERGPAGLTNTWKAYAAFPQLLAANWDRMQVLTHTGTLSSRLRKAINYEVAKANTCHR